MDLEVKFVYGSKSSINNHPITNGTVFVSTDTKEMFIDLNDNRLSISNMIILDTETDRSNTLAPIPNKFYYVKETNKLYLYTSDWNLLSSSAYDLAVDNGFEGSVEEWLESLKGDKGDTGVGIKSIEQTTITTEPNGENIITCLLTDGTEVKFKVYNGKQASGITLSYNLLASEWKEDFTYSISSEFITEDNIVTLSPSKNISLEQYNALASAKIISISQSNGSITLKSLGNIPSIDIPLEIIIHGSSIDNIINEVLLTDDTTGEVYKLGVDNGDHYYEKVVT